MQICHLARGLEVLRSVQTVPELCSISQVSQMEDKGLDNLFEVTKQINGQNPVRAYTFLLKVRYHLKPRSHMN